MTFRVFEKRFLHSGQTDPYGHEVATVEAASAAEVPAEFAASKGFSPNSVLRRSETRFDIGNTSYSISPR